MSKEVFKDMYKYLPAYIAPTIIGLAIIPVVTRLFTADIYGKYVLVMTTVGILTTLTGWIPTAAYRYYFDYKKNKKTGEFLVTSFKLLFTSAIFVGLMYVFFLHSVLTKLGTYLYSLLLIGLLVFFLKDISRLLNEILRLERKINWYSLFAVVEGVGSFTIGLILIMRFRWGIEGLLWGAVICLLLALPFMIKTLINSVSTVTKNGFSKNLSFAMAKYGFPIVIGNLASWILSLSDRYFLELFRGSYEVGVYSIGYGISAQTVGLLSSLFVLATGPIGMKIWEYEGEVAAQKFISKTTRYSMVMLLPCCAGLSILAKPILTIFTTGDYIKSYKIMPLVAFGVFFFEFRGRFLAGLLYHKKTNFIMIGTLVAAIINVVLNFIFIPKYGYVAAAATTFIAYFALFVLIVLFSRRFFIWDFPFKTLLNTILASTFMSAVVYLLMSVVKINPIINIIFFVLIGALIYFLTLFILGEIRDNEIAAVKKTILRVLGKR